MDPRERSALNDALDRVLRGEPSAQNALAVDMRVCCDFCNDVVPLDERLVAVAVFEFQAHRTPAAPTLLLHATPCFGEARDAVLHRTHPYPALALVPIADVN